MVANIWQDICNFHFDTIALDNIRISSKFKISIKDDKYRKTC